MKKIIITAVCVSYLMASCSIFHKEKYGCPGSPEANGGTTNDIKILNGDPKAIKAAEKQKMKSGRSSY